MKTKTTKKQERKQRLETFRNTILPIISNMYEVSSHGPSNAPNTMYKITIHTELSYDYYPMSEKIRKKRGNEYQWGSVPINEIIDSLKRLKKIK